MRDESEGEVRSSSTTYKSFSSIDEMPKPTFIYTLKTTSTESSPSTEHVGRTKINKNDMVSHRPLLSFRNPK